MMKRAVGLAGRLTLTAAIILSLTGCGERVSGGGEATVKQTEKAAQIETAAQTEAQTQRPTEKQTEASTQPSTQPATEKESETQKLITSVDYTSKDGSIKITLPDNTWKVTQDADEMRVFQSGNDAIINIVHANTDTAMKNLSVSTSEEELKASLTKQYAVEDAFEIQDYSTTNVNGVNIYRYTVKYNTQARMWAYSVTNAIVAQDQAYVVTGTVTDDNPTLLADVKKAVESFRVLNDDTLKDVTGDVISGVSSKTPETVDTNTGSDQELSSLTDYGSSATLVTNDNVNVRMSPGTDGDILTTLTPNAQVTVTGETANWFQVNIEGNTGYIRKDFLVYGNATTNQTTTSSETQASAGGSESSGEMGTATNYGGSTTLYASSDVNVRSAPGTDSNVINGLGTGTAVSVIGETDNWFIVSIGGTTGYVNKAFLTYDSSVSNGTTATNSGDSGQTSSSGNNTGTDNSGTGNSESTSSGNSAGSDMSAVSGTVTGTTVDTITVTSDNGQSYTIYYGDAGVSSVDGLYDGVYVSVALDGAQAASDGTLYATNVQGY